MLQKFIFDKLSDKKNRLKIALQVSKLELCNYVIITIAAWLKIENWASGVMFDRARSQLTGKEVVSHS